MTYHDPETDTVLELLEGAGLVEAYVNTDGKQAMRLDADSTPIRSPHGEAAAAVI